MIAGQPIACSTKVFVVNKSGHDFSDAARYGELVYLSTGRMNRYEPNQMFREFVEHLQSSTARDYILLCGLNVMNVVACSIFAARHKRINLLLFQDGRYVERNLILEE